MYSENGTAITIGNFDGLHLGHRKVIETLLKNSKKTWEKIAITFHPHPLVILKPEKAPPMIIPLEKRIEEIKGMKIDRVVVINSNRNFLNLTAEEFCKKFLSDLNPKLITIGSTFKFGKNRMGDVKFLQHFFRNKDTKIISVREEKWNGKTISSTWIRELLKKGNIELTNKFLGKEYEIEGYVIKGDGIGKKLGFPTANLYTNYSKLLPNGVYITKSIVSGIEYCSITNIGKRPTISGNENETIETYIFDFNNNIYNEFVKIKFFKKIRNEEKFNSLEELKNRIKKDIEISKTFFKEMVKNGNQQRLSEKNI